MQALEWNELWEAMQANPTPWVDTTEAMYDDMLNALPPQDMAWGGFLVGEPYTHNGNGEAVYACFIHANGAYQARYMTQREFNQWKAVRA